jgi:polysaccharide biosynthesis transport protein
LSVSTSLMPVPMQPGSMPPLLAPPAPDSEESSAGMSVMQVMCILRAFWKHSLITAAVVVVLGTIGIQMMPKMYVSQSTVQINRLGRDPLAPGGELPVSFIPTQMELINSAVVLMPVIDQLHLVNDPQLTHGFTGTPAAVHDAVIASLRDSLTVTAGRGSDLLYIAISYPTAQRAADIANAVTEEYIKQERIRVTKPAGEGLALFSHDVDDLRRKVDDAQQRVTEFRKQHVLIELDNDNVDAGALADLEGKLLAAQNTVREYESSPIAANASSDQVIGSNGVPALRDKLAVQQEQMAQLLQTLGPKHPNVMELQAQINTTRHLLEGEVASISSNRQMSLSHARQLVTQYQAAVEAQRARMVERRSLQEQGSALNLQLKSAQAAYSKALEGFETNRIGTAAATGHISLVEGATPAVKATKPNKPKLFIMALLAGLAIGLGWPFAYELLVDRRLRCRDDLERTFGMPVLAQFGPIGAGTA